MTLLSGEIKGAASLRQVAKIFFDGAQAIDLPAATNGKPIQTVRHSRDDILPRIQPNSQRRTVFFAGKGGVGKTVASCITAVWLAQQGYKTLLLTTDPAAHLGDVLGQPVGDTPAPLAGLPDLVGGEDRPQSSRRDIHGAHPERCPPAWPPGSGDPVMAEELDSPCTEEMAAFDQFIDYASQSEWERVVFDTAPTGHTLRLLELPMDWSQQMDVKVFASVDTGPPITWPSSASAR